MPLAWMSTLFPYTTLFRSIIRYGQRHGPVRQRSLTVRGDSDRIARRGDLLRLPGCVAGQLSFPDGPVAGAMALWRILAGGQSRGWWTRERHHRAVAFFDLRERIPGPAVVCESGQRVPGLCSALWRRLGVGLWRLAARQQRGADL